MGRPTWMYVAFSYPERVSTRLTYIIALKIIATNIATNCTIITILALLPPPDHCCHCQYHHHHTYYCNNNNSNNKTNNNGLFLSVLVAAVVHWWWLVMARWWWWLSGGGNSGSRSKMIMAEGQLIVAVYLSLCLYKNLLLSQNNSENINFE